MFCLILYFILWNCTCYLTDIFTSNLSRIFYRLQSKYKSLLVSEQTTVDELIQMLLSCYSSKERVEQFSLYEVCEGEEYQRKLHPDDSPLKVTQRWASADRHLRIRRNPDYNPHRRKVRKPVINYLQIPLINPQLPEKLSKYFYWTLGIRIWKASSILFYSAS